MKPFRLEIWVIEPASASSSCSSHFTIGDKAVEVVSDVCGQPEHKELDQSVACRM